ncbi:Diamine acetyltransferase 2 [Liparis tanakae]|uniref:Diamine acetyltransferase 2 n=1 Tax=Liparis tanakae TaxID=230148 RepID=A0A4Z2JF26_9TELE|nr:Diamine acetyltransferase 2 [Liparis tanakae]
MLEPCVRVELAGLGGVGVVEELSRLHPDPDLLGGSLELADFEKVSDQVKITHEGKGIGNSLMSKVAEVGKKKQCVRLHLTVSDWNTPARDFYAAKGAQDLTASLGRHLLHFSGRDLDNLANEAPEEDFAAVVSPEGGTTLSSNDEMDKV